jgi:PmbA protein
MPLTKDLVKKLLNNAKKKSDEAEVYAATTKQLKIDVMGQKPESVDNITEGGLSLRIIKDKRPGFAYTADLDEHSLELLVEQAVENSKSAQPDEYAAFPSPKKQPAILKLVEPNIEGTKLSDKLEFALHLEGYARSFDNRVKKTEKVSYFDSVSSTFIANSKGVDVHYEKAVCGAFADIIAEENGMMESGSWNKFAVNFNDLDPKYIGEEAAKRAVMMLGAKQEKSGRAPVILSPYAGSILISAIFPALSAEFVQKGKSLFVSAMDKSIASPKLSLIDSGILPGGTASAPYDDEGTPTGETAVIKNGILRTYLHDSYTAKKGKKTSTANAFRSSYMSQPSIQPTNLYVRPGSVTKDEILSGVSKGFLVTSIMGAHTINPITGDFSVGFSGFFIDNGRISKPVRGMTLAGNMLDVLSHIEDVGSDLAFFQHGGSIGSPSILIRSLSVSGS